MVQRTKVVMTDDLDGSPAEGTVIFGLDGQFYEMELSAKNAVKFRKKLQPFIAKARKSTIEVTVSRPRTAASRRQSREIRNWAKEQGLVFSERGRIPESVVAAYRAGH